MNIAAPASLPPSDLPGLDPSWSRLVDAPDSQGAVRTWHVLDAWPADPVGTLLCVHGNPTWSYTFRSMFAAASDRWRVVAPDHLNMGFSERVDAPLRLADRVAELGSLTTTLKLRWPVVVLAHDWGGSISLGWALEHRDLVAGIVLLNTAVSQPAHAKAPRLIRLARSNPLRRSVTQRTDLFVRGTLGQARPKLAKGVANAYRAPYATADSRHGIADFVADIPLEPSHTSQATLTNIANRLPELRNVATLLAWGTKDPVFNDRYLRDLQRRLPNARTHRYEDAGHLVIEDAPIALVALRFGDDVVNSSLTTGEAPHVARDTASRQPLWAAISERAELDKAGSDSAAIVEMGRHSQRRSISWPQLHTVVEELAAGMNAVGISPGDRVALLVPPGADLTAVLYATWRAGAVAVVADAGLGLAGLRRALRGANVQHTFGELKGLAAARAMGLQGTFVSVGSLSRPTRASLRIDYGLAELRDIGRGRPHVPSPSASDEAAVLFTSGATGPAKGVVYRHQQLEAQRELVRTAFGVNSSDRLVAAFAPFALFGPALGITTVTPHMDVTAPGTLTARSLAAAVRSTDASLVFAAPAALRNILRTSGALRRDEREALKSIRMLLSAGAPVPVDVLRAAADLLGGCDAHTPYGMTEALPISDVTLAEIEASPDGPGVLVGHPIEGVQVAVSPLDFEGLPTGALTDESGVTGEVCVRGPHVKDHYDQLWSTERESARDLGWHRTGDVGQLDDDGRLWIEGRLAHLIRTANGVVTPVAIERAAESLPEIRLAAAVGVGPTDSQVVAVVVEAPRLHPGLAPLELLDEVRSVSDTPIVAVLVVRELPVDIRHNSKIDRARVARWAELVLAGDARATL